MSALGTGDATAFFRRQFPDDELTTETSNDQAETEDACRDTFEEFADEDGNLDRES